MIPDSSMRLPRRMMMWKSPLKLDPNRLRRQRFVFPGARTGPSFIRWSYTYTDEEICHGLITADLGATYGSLRIQIGSLDQTLSLRRESRRYGGGQWYFECPRT